MDFAVIEYMFFPETGQNLSDTVTDRGAFHPQKGLKLSGKRMGGAVFHGCAGADRIQTGIRKMLFDIGKDLFVTKRFRDTEKRRNKK